MRQGVSAAAPSFTAMLLRGTRVSARAPAALAAGQAQERSCLSRQSRTRTTRVARTQPRLLARITPHAPAVPRAQPHAATRAQRPAARALDCKDGRLNTGFSHPLRHIPDQPGAAGRDCKDGRVDGANHFASSAIQSTSGRLQRDDVIGDARRNCYRAKLLENKQVVRFLKQRQSEVLAEFETIVQTVSSEQ